MSPPHHVVNEDYGNYIKRQRLKGHRSAVWFVAIGIFFVIVYVFGNIFEKTGLMNAKSTIGQIIFTILGWGVMIFGIYLGYKFFKKYYIHRRRYSRRELIDIDE